MWTGAPALGGQIEAVELVQTGEAVLRGAKSLNNHRRVDCFGSEGAFKGHPVQPLCNELRTRHRIIKVQKVLQDHRGLESCWQNPFQPD